MLRHTIGVPSSSSTFVRVPPAMLTSRATGADPATRPSTRCGPASTKIGAGSGVAVMPAAMQLVPTVESMLHSGGLDGGRFMGLAVKEGIVGLVIGYLLAAPFWAMEAVGFLVDNQRGASIAATSSAEGGSTGGRTSALRKMPRQTMPAFMRA